MEIDRSKEQTPSLEEGLRQVTPVTKTPFSSRVYIFMIPYSHYFSSSD